MQKSLYKEVRYMFYFLQVVKYSLCKGQSLAGFFAESIQGVGGTVQYPKGYLKQAFKRTRELGGVCISDEVSIKPRAPMYEVWCVRTYVLSDLYLGFYFARSRLVSVAPVITFGASSLTVCLRTS